MDAGYLQRVVGIHVPQGGPGIVLRKPGDTAAVSSAAAAAPARGASASAGKGSAAGCGCCGFPRIGKFAPQAVEREGHPAWLQPEGGFDSGLRVYNSLTGDKEMFVPLDGRKVRWYTCGPTVYDVAHMGHARAYLTFDILRRVMSKYLGYELIYQINITDIDDKIILRSRQNKLFSEFCKKAEGMDAKAVKKEVDAAVDLAEKKLKGKAPKTPAADADKREKAEFEKLVQEHELKLGQFAELKKSIAEASKGSKEELIKVARDPLSAKLDKELGHTMSDNAISEAHARHFEDEYFQDMDALGVLRPDVVTRITDYMDGRVQKFIEKLEEEKFCYESNGSVYFSIDEFKKQGYDYRKLVPAASASAAEMAEGEGALAAEDAEKRNPNDFAVWKASKPGEPSWGSKWGPGRPGWHIECSVMATDIQGEYLDIHAGGEDLKFPHHDNEMAQSEAFLHTPQWVNYFWHAGHLHIEGLKMSKSLKNFITIRQALQMHSARQLRLMFLMQPWDKGMNYSDQAIDMARAEERKVKHFLGSLKFHKRQPNGKGPKGKREEDLAKLVTKTEEDVGKALKDNFGTPAVISAISGLVSECYATYEALPEAHLEPVEKAAALVVKVLDVLGVENLAPEPADAAARTTVLDAFAGLRQRVRQLAKEGLTPAKVDEALKQFAVKPGAAKDCTEVFEAFRKDLEAMAKAGKPQGEFLKRCDEVRDRDFVKLGVRLEDTKTSYLWMFDNKEVLEREAQEQAEKAASAGLAKLGKRLEEKRTQLKSAEKAALAPSELFKTGANQGLYSAFDEKGVPTALSSGEEISKSKKKDLQKQFDKQQKDYDALLKKAGAEGIEAFMAKMRQEVADLEQQVNRS